MSILDFKKPNLQPSIKDGQINRRNMQELYEYVNGDKIKTISSSTYTIKEEDTGAYLHFTATCTITLPNTYTRKVECLVVNKGSGTLTFSATTTLEAKASGTELATQYSAATIKHEGKGVWGAYGLD